MEAEREILEVDESYETMLCLMSIARSLFVLGYSRPGDAR
jgi:hypothetical protein